jgi:hypothetical protein
LRKVRENTGAARPLLGNISALKRPIFVNRYLQRSLENEKMWTPCNRIGAKVGQSEVKILFSINKLSAFAHHEVVRTDSDAKRERELAMAKAAVKAKGRAKKKAAKKPAARKRKTRR